MELETLMILIWIGVIILWIGGLFISYRLVKYGIKNDVIWPMVLAFLLSGLLPAVIFYFFLRDKKNRKDKEKEREEERERRYSERSQFKEREREKTDY